MSIDFIDMINKNSYFKPIEFLIIDVYNLYAIAILGNRTRSGPEGSSLKDF